ncbi:oxidoreductase [Rhypophila decipiens]|uniref:Oxidoreductase n=1 Tax=Rhypophila decipiens TaxID=261697 RepID=A0AAN6Y7C7_9PEZI|nr:oxidoreductase [Rhypophila decipiens]
MLLLSMVLTATAGAADNVNNPYKCTHPSYQVHKVSSSPLVIYIQNFMTPSERQHLRQISSSTFRRSAVAGNSGAQRVGIRTSQSTSLPPSDPIARCISERAISFQGFDIHESQLEPLQLVKYAQTERYDFHTDWLSDPNYVTSFNGGNRQSSFFVYVHVSNDTTGGGTNFPLLAAPHDNKWCDLGILECDELYTNGVTFRPLEGNAIFWENLLPESGEGDPRTEHAGLPLTSGDKMGMNIWTRQMPLSEEARREDLPVDF